MRSLYILMSYLSFSYKMFLVSAVPSGASVDFVDSIASDDPSTFGQDLWFIIKDAISGLRPDIAEAAALCAGILSIVMLLSVVECFAGKSNKIVSLTAAVSIGLLLIRPAQAMITLGTETIRSMSDYGKLLLPVMTASLAAQGGTTSATALYMGTAIFDAVLTTVVSNIFIPLVYIYVFVAIARGAVSETLLDKLQSFIKWLITWGLKLILYIFTGYMGISNLITGSVDAAAVKAAKLTISGVVPVVGGILSDASESILLGASMMKNATGTGGLVAVAAIFVGPFLRIGIQYLILKFTAATATVFSSGAANTIIKEYTTAMGFLLAMTGTACLMVFISTVCFMKGIG